MSYYFHISNWSVDTNPVGGIKIPTIAVFLIVPLIGLAFLMFLPFIGFYLCIVALLNKVRSLVVAVSRPSMIVGEAHLTGHPAEGKGGDELADLEEEVTRRRT